MKKVFYCFAVGMLFLGSFVVSGIAGDNNDMPITEKEKSEYIPVMGTFHVYIWDEIRYDVELDDNHEDIYIDKWDNADVNKTKQVMFNYTVHNPGNLEIKGKHSHTFYFRIRQWPPPPLSVWFFLMRYTGQITVDSCDYTNCVTKDNDDLREGKLMIPMKINWNQSSSFHEQSGSVLVNITFKSWPNDINIVGLMWAGWGGILSGSLYNYDFSVLHVGFYEEPSPP